MPWDGEQQDIYYQQQQMQLRGHHQFQQQQAYEQQQYEFAMQQQQQHRAHSYHQGIPQQHMYPMAPHQVSPGGRIMDEFKDPHYAFVEHQQPFYEQPELFYQQYQ